MISLDISFQPKPILRRVQLDFPVFHLLHKLGAGQFERAIRRVHHDKSAGMQIVLHEIPHLRVHLYAVPFEGLFRYPVRTNNISCCIELSPVEGRFTFRDAGTVFVNLALIFGTPPVTRFSHVAIKQRRLLRSITLFRSFFSALVFRLNWLSFSC